MQPGSRVPLDSRDISQQTSQSSSIDRAGKPWIRQLSELNVEIHQQLSLMPPTTIWQGTCGDASIGDGPGSAHMNQSLGADHTLRLSADFLSSVRDAVSQLKNGQTSNGPVIDGAMASELQPHSQMLILSTYASLIELHSKTLDHVKGWTEVRLGGERASPAPNDYPVQLPSVVIGSYEFPASSPMRSLMLVSAIEGLLANARDLLDEAIRPTRSPRKEATSPGTTIDEQGTAASGAPSNAAQASLQALRSQEDRMLALVEEIWRLAVRCGAS